MLRPETGIVLPALMFLPEKPNNEVTLYVNGTVKRQTRSVRSRPA